MPAGSQPSTTMPRLRLWSCPLALSARTTSEVRTWGGLLVGSGPSMPAQSQIDRCTSRGSWADPVGHTRTDHKKPSPVSVAACCCWDAGAGGTCVIRGCVPKKLLVYGAMFNEEFNDAVGFGWAAQRPPHDWKCEWQGCCALFGVARGGGGGRGHQLHSQPWHSGSSHPTQHTAGRVAWVGPPLACGFKWLRVSAAETVCANQKFTCRNP